MDSIQALLEMVGLPVRTQCKFLNSRLKGNTMNEDVAKSKADDLVKLIIQYQPNLFGVGVPALGDSEKAKKVAQSLSALRAELIAQLEKQ